MSRKHFRSHGYTYAGGSHVEGLPKARTRFSRRMIVVAWLTAGYFVTVLGVIAWCVVTNQ